MTEVTAEQVLAKIARDDRFAVNCLLQLYARQTADEQQAQATGHKNRMGFNGTDAGILSSFSEQVLRWRADEAPRFASPLSQKQMSLLRSKIQKYARQLTEATNAALAAKEAAAVPQQTHQALSQAMGEVEYQEGQTQQQYEQAVRTRANHLGADLDRLCPPDNFDRELAERKVVRVCSHGGDCLCAEAPELSDYDLSACNPRSDVIEDMLAETARKHGIVDLGPAPVEPSCRLIAEGNNLRFPTANELWQDSVRGQRELNERLGTQSAARWTRPLDEGEDIFSE